MLLIQEVFILNQASYLPESTIYRNWGWYDNWASCEASWKQLLSLQLQYSTMPGRLQINFHWSRGWHWGYRHITNHSRTASKMTGHVRLDRTWISLLEDQIFRPNIDQPPEDSRWQPCEIIWPCKVRKLIPLRRISNLSEAIVEMFRMDFQTKNI